MGVKSMSKYIELTMTWNRASIEGGLSKMGTTIYLI